MQRVMKMSDSWREFAATFDDPSVDPLTDEVGSFDELVPKNHSRNAKGGTNEQPWLEIALIAFVLLAGYLFGFLAFIKL